jgi:hypothetical protein
LAAAKAGGHRQSRLETESSQIRTRTHPLSFLVPFLPFPFPFSFFLFPFPFSLFPLSSVACGWQRWMPNDLDGPSLLGTRPRPQSRTHSHTSSHHRDRCRQQRRRVRFRPRTDVARTSRSRASTLRLFFCPVGRAERAVRACGWHSARRADKWRGSYLPIRF